MNVKMLKVAFAGLVLSASSFANANLINNGSFESGDLTGWTTSGLGLTGTCPSANRDWNVSSTSSTGCSIVSNPTDGSYAVYNMLDGTGPLKYVLSQQISLASGITSASLSWMESANWGFNGADRVFDINILDSTGVTLLTNLYTESFTGSGNFGWQTHNLDVLSALSPFQGQNVTIAFTTSIPNNWTGPAGFGLDAIALNVTTSVPEPTTLAIFALGIMGLASRKFKKS